MEIIFLVLIGFLLTFIVFKEILHYMERDLLTKKLMARNFIEYTNADLAKEQIKQQDPEKRQDSHIF